MLNAVNHCLRNVQHLSVNILDLLLPKITDYLLAHRRLSRGSTTGHPDHEGTLDPRVAASPSGADTAAGGGRPVTHDRLGEERSD